MPQEGIGGRAMIFSHVTVRFRNSSRPQTDKTAPVVRAVFGVSFPDFLARILHT
jgi:hypothetical protein